jgi:hypothetical protein
MQDALCAGMQRFLDTEIQVETCLVTGCLDFWMQDALLHGCRDTGRSMPRYIDAQIFGCRVHWCKDLEMMHGCRDTGGSMPRYIDARICGCRMHWSKDVEMHGCRDTGGSMPGCMAAWNGKDEVLREWYCKLHGNLV